MLKSMTGYGRGEAVGTGRKFTVELKAVNHRYCEVVIRLPRYLMVLEDRMRRRVQSFVSRGRVDVFLTIEEGEECSRAVKVDKALALAYYGAINEIKQDLALSGPISIDQIINQPQVFSLDESRDNPEDWWSAIEKALTDACRALIEMRATEGRALCSDLGKRLDYLGDMVRQVEMQAPDVVRAYQTRLTQRIQELVADMDIDETRLAQETAHFAERSDISEELVRLDSHLNQMRDLLDAETAVGRRLDFLAQEMFREINTIGSKAQDEVITARVVDFKSELEKTREQIQNIE